MDDNQNKTQKIDDSIQVEADNQLPKEKTPSEEELKKKMEAILAMEGEEGRKRREDAEKAKKEAEMLNVLEAEKAELKNKLAEIAKKKEVFEIKWIDFSEKKKGLEDLLLPITESELTKEKEVQAKNQEEHATDDVKKRQSFEKERQSLEAERQKIEKEKWVIENKLEELRIVMEENKADYQKLLKEEYTIIDKVAEIDKKEESIKQ